MEKTDEKNTTQVNRQPEPNENKELEEKRFAKEEPQAKESQENLTDQNQSDDFLLLCPACQSHNITITDDLLLECLDCHQIFEPDLNEIPLDELARSVIITAHRDMARGQSEAEFIEQRLNKGIELLLSLKDEMEDFSDQYWAVAFAFESLGDLYLGKNESGNQKAVSSYKKALDFLKTYQRLRPQDPDIIQEGLIRDKLAVVLNSLNQSQPARVQRKKAVRLFEKALKEKDQHSDLVILSMAYRRLSFNLAVLATQSFMSKKAGQAKGYLTSLIKLLAQCLNLDPEKETMFYGGLSFAYGLLAQIVSQSKNKAERAQAEVFEQEKESCFKLAKGEEGLAAFMEWTGLDSGQNVKNRFNRPASLLESETDWLAQEKKMDEAQKHWETLSQTEQKQLQSEYEKAFTNYVKEFVKVASPEDITLNTAKLLSQIREGSLMLAKQSSNLDLDHFEVERLFFFALSFAAEYHQAGYVEEALMMLDAATDLCRDSMMYYADFRISDQNALASLLLEITLIIMQDLTLTSKNSHYFDETWDLIEDLQQRGELLEPRLYQAAQITREYQLSHQGR